MSNSTYLEYEQVACETSGALNRYNSGLFSGGALKNICILDCLAL